MSFATKTVKVRRTYLVERIEEVSVEIPAAYDVDEWLANDSRGFNDYLSENGEVDHEDYASVEDDNLDFEVLS